MLRLVVALLAAPIAIAAAQTPQPEPIQIPISAGLVTFTLTAGDYSLTQDVAGGRSTADPRVIKGDGSLAYNLRAGESVLLAVGRLSDTLHVEIKDQGRTVAFANGKVVAIRRHDGLLSLDVESDTLRGVPRRSPWQH